MPEARNWGSKGLIVRTCSIEFTPTRMAQYSGSPFARPVHMRTIALRHQYQGTDQGLLRSVAEEFCKHEPMHRAGKRGNVMRNHWRGTKHIKPHRRLRARHLCALSRA